MNRLKELEYLNKISFRTILDFLFWKFKTGKGYLFLEKTENRGLIIVNDKILMEKLMNLIKEEKIITM
jgi:hypothetical protein